VDAGCGTGRALPALRDAVGPDGTVIALQLTPQMLAQARSRGWAKCADLLVLADARALPFAAGSVDAVFAAGLVNHLPDPQAGFTELAGSAANARGAEAGIRACSAFNDEQARNLMVSRAWRFLSYLPADYRCRELLFCIRKKMLGPK
jgi:SAM-dependent methyltransferase